MKWEKKGIIWEPTGIYPWAHKYGMLPVPLYIPDKNIVRVYFGTTDRLNFGRIGYLDLNPDNFNDVTYINPEPVLDIGQLGTFDDSGVVPSSIVIKNDRILLYTIGFQRCERVPYMLFAGLAISNDFGNTFQRFSQSPILPRNEFRPTSQGAPSVIFHNGVYKMWHWFSTKWITINNKLYLDYKIGYAESKDGYKWEMENITCIAPDPEKKEFATARPWVIVEDGLFKMWYSIRFTDKLYRLGYAESIDGKSWERMDDLVGIDVSDSGWDSEMICYPAILNIKEKKYLFYNGNNNGATGFGYAELVG